MRRATSLREIPSFRSFVARNRRSSRTWEEPLGRMAAPSFPGPDYIALIMQGSIRSPRLQSGEGGEFLCELLVPPTSIITPRHSSAQVITQLQELACARSGVMSTRSPRLVFPSPLKSRHLLYIELAKNTVAAVISDSEHWDGCGVHVFPGSRHSYALLCGRIIRNTERRPSDTKRAVSLYN